LKLFKFTYYKAILAVIIFLFCSSGLYSQWAPRLKEGGAIFSLRYSQSSEYYDPSGIKKSSENDATFRKYEMGVYYSIGLGKRFGAFAGLSLAALSYSDLYIDNKSFGFTNPTVGAVYQFTEYPKLITGVIASVVLPLHFPRNAEIELGGKFFEYDLAFAVADAFRIGKLPGFWSLGFAGRYRANEFDEFQLRIYSYDGLDFSKKFSFFWGLEYSAATNTSFRVFKLGGTLLYKFNKTVGLGLFGEYIPYGRNIGIGPMAGLSLWYSF
jgi:hypothetical protein